tara:strand:- start:178697 stop:180136 length:1440 start_codon:yes stop_codon:yes gene_type:complete
MLNCLYLNGSDFKKTNFKYSGIVSPNPKIEKYRNGYRITFYLTTGKREHYYGLMTDSCKTEAARNKTVREFESLVRNGCFPLKSISKLEKFEVKSKKGQTLFLDGMSLYYTDFNKGRHRKRDSNIARQEPTLKYLLKTVSKRTGKRYLEEVDTNDLQQIEDNLQKWCAENGKPINIVTAASYKRLLKAYFNCLAKKLGLNMNPAVISSTPETNGHENETVGTRTVTYPKELLSAVDSYPFETPFNYPDRKEMIYLYRTTGIAKGEMSTLSEENLYPDKYNFDSIILMDKPDCPTNIEMGFQVKTHNRHKRIIPLDERCIAYIKSQQIKHRNHEIYGRITPKGGTTSYKKYRFLFPIYRHGRWQRCDDFLKGIQNLVDDASKHFGLAYRGKDYQVHDFRNTLNEEMGDKGISAEDRAYILGHSKEVNEKNYMNDDKRKELRARTAHAAFREKMLHKDTPPRPPEASSVAQVPKLRLVADQ